ncbi:hypothetical protein TI39_contig356g00001 [Zymoseptoria brevis]|uniref:Transcription factor domain-containing protein n=1 Tax=Zymoseptoria brevis TaxID=1047168 RepID=A0A0F4GTG1_9PEZI|nr:hypothetical protein TI39_contig356g00001 [Zymoseptoria brevis]
MLDRLTQSPAGRSSGHTSVDTCAGGTLAKEHLAHKAKFCAVLYDWPQVSSLVTLQPGRYSTTRLRDEPSMLRLDSPRETHAQGCLPSGNTLSNGGADDVPLDSAEVDALHQSYMLNIHVMHPFLDHQRLSSILHDFKVGKCGIRSPEICIVYSVLALGSLFLPQHVLPSNANLYYAKAATIRGWLMDGSELVIAQIFLLGALYKYQVAEFEASMNLPARRGALSRRSSIETRYSTIAIGTLPATFARFTLP